MANKQTDWPKIKALYLVGWLPRELSKEFGVSVSAVNKQIVRGRWATLKVEVRASLKKAVQCSLEESSKSVRSGLSKELIRQVETLDQVPLAPTLTDIGERASVVNNVVSSASKVFGWADRMPNILIDIAVLNPDNPPPVPIIDSPAMLPDSTQGEPLPEASQG